MASARSRGRRTRRDAPTTRGPAQMIYVYTLGETSIEIDPPDHQPAGVDPFSPDRRRARQRVVPTARRRFAILLYLALQRGRRTGRERLQTLVYPEPSSK